jgi:acyl-CoA thioesterase
MTEDEQGKAALEAARQGVNRMGIATLLGMQIERTQDGMGRVRIVVDERLMHPQQMVHGGVLFTLADTAMSMAVISEIGPGMRFSTIEAKINFLAPVREGELVAEATVVQRGRSIAVLEATVFNENGEGRQAVARALGTFSISSKKYEHKG